MAPARKLNSIRLRVEPLEDRTVPSTFWVTNTRDAGPGSLRQALLDATARPGADVIRFRPAAEGTITLTSELVLTDELTVRGPGPGRLTVSGGGTTRVLDIAAGARVTIANLTVAHGQVAGTDRGAGVRNQGTLTLDSVVVRDSASDSVGGGIANAGALTLRRSRVAANRAETGGGGLHNAAGGVAELVRSVVRDNTCVGDGAGIRSEVGATLTITHSTISGNAASGFGTGGLASGGVLTVRDTRVHHNTSAAGGIYLFGFAAGGDVVIARSVIRDNGPNATSGAGVGGLWSRSLGSIRVEDTVIRRNSGRLAGGVFGSGDMEFVGSTIDRNTGRSAGGVYSIGTLTLTRSKVSGNTGDTGGVRAPAVTVVESTISGNAGTSVGGIYGYQLDLIRSTVSGNAAAPAGDGFSAALGVGGVSITNGRIQNSTVSGNAVLAGQMHPYYSPYGDSRDATGGVFASAGLGGAAVAIENSTVAFNRVEGAPAAIRASGGVAAARPVTFTYAGNTYESFTVVGVRNTIVGRNLADAGAPDVGGEVRSGGHNLIGVLTPDATGFGCSDRTGSPADPLDPRLRPLAANGGPTRTHALRPRSPAVDAGDNADAPPTDQRGRQRVAHGVIDIGAYESRSPRVVGSAAGARQFASAVALGTDIIGSAVAAEPPRASRRGQDTETDHDRRGSPDSVGRQPAGPAEAVPVAIGQAPAAGAASGPAAGTESPGVASGGVAWIDGN